MVQRVIFRRGTTGEWEQADPILEAGEPGFDRLTRILKLGDGVSRWSELSGLGTSGSGEGAPAEHTHPLPAHEHDLPAHSHPVTDLTASGTRDATTFLRGDGIWATPASGGSGGLTVSGTKTVGRVPTVGSDSSTVSWADLPSAAGYPYLVTPASDTTDIGALINTKLQTYGVAIVAPHPTGWWTQTTPIDVGLGEAVLGFGQGTSRIRAGSGLGANPMFRYRSGNVGHITIRGLALNGNNIANRAVYIYQTSQPSSALPNPDAANVLDDLFVQNTTGDGIYIGGSGAYSGNARETRLRNSIVKGCGGWGVNIESSDCFITDVTTHGNGPGGFNTTSGQSGNAKFVHCKAYYETIGLNSGAVRATITGGEWQDCGTGIVIAADSHVATTIDSCGTASTAGIRVTGSGCTFMLHMVGRSSPSGSPGTGFNAAIELSSGTQVHAGTINTNVLGRTYDYKTKYQNANRPAATSTLVVSPA